jgi:D-alanine-D-alanine ligase
MTIHVDPDWWKTLFDDVYLVTDARSVCNPDVTCKEVDVFSRLIPMDRSHHILDLCGGHGRHALELCRRGFKHCTVLDYSECLLKRGEETAAHHGCPVSFVHGDARNTAFPPGRFHHVMVLGNSLGYVPDPRADADILAEAFRVLKVGGWLLLDVADGASIKQRFTPNAWHEIGEDVVVCRQRERDGDTIGAREMVISKAKGLIRDRTYCMRLYEPQGLAAAATRAGFANAAIHTDFSPHLNKGDYGFMNHRMIITAQKL